LNLTRAKFEELAASLIDRCKTPVERAISDAKISTSDIQEFSLEGEDFKLEINRNLFDQNQLTNNLVSSNSIDRKSIANQNSIKLVHLKHMP